MGSGGVVGAGSEKWRVSLLAAVGKEGSEEAAESMEAGRRNEFEYACWVAADRGGGGSAEKWASDEDMRGGGDMVEPRGLGCGAGWALRPRSAALL